MVLIKLNSDNFDGVYLTPETYEVVALQMSAGDHATHKIEALVCPKDNYPEHYTWCDEINDLVLMNASGAYAK